MSVGVCVFYEAGVVVATDSRRVAFTDAPNPSWEIASEKARKLFVVDQRLVVATHGEAMVGGATVGAKMDELEIQADDPHDFAERLGDRFGAELAAARPPRRGDLVYADGLRWPLAFVVVGYADGVGRAYQVGVRAGDYRVSVLSEPTTKNPGVYSFGEDDGIRRLIHGIDHRALRDASAAPSDTEREKLDLLAYDLHPLEDVGDAADFAERLIEIQLVAQRFSAGTYARKENRIEACNDSIRAVVVAPDGADWLRDDPLARERGFRGRADEAPGRVARRG